MNTLIEKEKIKRYYFLILRNIRHPLKDTKSLYNDEAKIDIYKEKIISEYKFESDIEIVTGLNFYQDYKKNLLGTKDKREKVDRFEKFLSNNFFMVIMYRLYQMKRLLN